ncbi:MAG: MBOAT family protein [Bacilli bacterium]|nr:MBOAT family protein [Bacilli bacterium]
MLFSSITFIYYFLPILLLVYFIVPKKYKNLVLLIFSLIFYFLGEPKYIVILILSCLLNYYFGKKVSTDKNKKLWLIISIIYNVGQLLVFKYTDFFIENINNIFNSGINYLYIVMPIGISFFTFQAMGYVFDIYMGKHKPASRLLDFMTYISLFPQLVAGPIVRYSDVEKDLVKRESNFDKFGEGITRFVIGLSKKVLLANVLGEFAGDLVEVDLLSSWLKPILFTLQIYFDFSGYSDMAIGLGLIFGFRFLENFNYPLIASSITDFWRRWHMSLSSWFRDYVYIPLGGNRKGLLKQIRNIFVVWFLTGFWHGASWNFIIWGLYFGVILVIEKMFLKKLIDRTKVLKYIYTSIIVVISFLIFSTDNIKDIFVSLGNMFMINDIPLTSSSTIYYLKNNLVLLIISIIGATPLMKCLVEKLRLSKFKKVVECLEIVIVISLLILTTAFLVDASFNPFLYFRF